MKNNSEINRRYSLGKGEVDSSILSGSTRNQSLSQSDSGLVRQFQAERYGNSTCPNVENAGTLFAPRSLAETIRALSKWRMALRRAGHGAEAHPLLYSSEIAILTLQGMQTTSFNQSEALQELARRNLIEFAEKFSAFSSH